MKFPNLISIHAPCTGSDDDASPVGLRDGDFNPRSLHGERRSCRADRRGWKGFQSTLPARGATIAARYFCQYFSYFNPRSLHGERRPPEAGSCRNAPFQSTLPARGATCCTMPVNAAFAISIHAPCTGSDAQRRRCRTREEYFNPRSLHGERRHPPRRAERKHRDFNPRSLHGERHQMM